jgi:hypothetical protein
MNRDGRDAPTAWVQRRNIHLHIRVRFAGMELSYSVLFQEQNLESIREIPAFTCGCSRTNLLAGFSSARLVHYSANGCARRICIFLASAELEHAMRAGKSSPWVL